MERKETEEDLRLLNRGRNFAYDQILRHDSYFKGVIEMARNFPDDDPKVYDARLDQIERDIQCLRTEWEM